MLPLLFIFSTCEGDKSFDDIVILFLQVRKEQLHTGADCCPVAVHGVVTNTFIDHVHKKRQHLLCLIQDWQVSSSFTTHCERISTGMMN